MSMSFNLYDKRKVLLEETLKKQGNGFFVRKQLGTPSGLLNQGATCYLNSLVQMLFNNKKIRESVFDYNSSTPILKELQKLFAKMQLSSHAAVSTKQLTVAFGWNNSTVIDHAFVTFNKHI